MEQVLDRKRSVNKLIEEYKGLSRNQRKEIGTAFREKFGFVTNRPLQSRMAKDMPMTAIEFAFLEQLVNEQLAIMEREAS